MSSMCDGMPDVEEEELPTESGVKVGQDSDEFRVSVNSLPQLIARIAAEVTSTTPQPTQPERDSMMELSEEQQDDVLAPEQVEAKVAALTKPMKDRSHYSSAVGRGRCLYLGLCIDGRYTPEYRLSLVHQRMWGLWYHR